MQRHSIALAGATVLAIGAVWLSAGPLDPPAGPITGTYKTLTDVEPRIVINAANTPGNSTNLYLITQPGSYYLAADVTGVAGMNGIGIAASNVTIDLNGFTLQGVDGSQSGICNLGDYSYHTVRNGRVRNWGVCGLLLEAGGRGSTVERVEALYNESDGMRLSQIANVSDCVASNNGWRGIYSASNAVVERCETRSNYDGISLGHGSTVEACVARANTHMGISVSDASTVIDCVAISNTEVGIYLNSYCTVRGCTVSANGTHGIVARSDCLVTQNASHRNGSIGEGAGIVVGGDDNRVEDNNVTENDIGVQAYVGGSLIIRNSASGNGANYSIAGGNCCGTIVTGEAAMNAANNANVNISY